MAKCNLFVCGVSVMAIDPSIQTYHVPLSDVRRFLVEAQNQRRGGWLKPDLWPCMLAVIEFFPSNPYLALVSSSFPTANDIGQAVEFRLVGDLFGVRCVPRIGKASFSTPKDAVMLLGTEAWEGGLMLQVSKAEDGAGVRAELSWKLELEKDEKSLIVELNLQNEAIARIEEVVFEESDILLASFSQKAATDRRGVVTSVIYFAAGNSGLFDFIG